METHNHATCISPNTSPVHDPFSQLRDLVNSNVSDMDDDAGSKDNLDHENDQFFDAV